MYEEPLNITAEMCLSHFGFPFVMHTEAIFVSEL